MSKILLAEIAEQQETFTKVAEKMRLPEVAIEKDVWVTAVLRSLFALPYLPVRAFISIENSNIPQPNLRRRFTLNH